VELALPRKDPALLAGATVLAVWVGLSFRGLAPGRERSTLLVVLGTCAALLVVFFAPRLATLALRAVERPSDRAFALGVAAVAAAISAALVTGPLHTRALSIDANVYLLEARALSHLHFGMPVPEPIQAFSGRFLFAGADGRLHGVFPPGFPLLVAPLVALGAPLLAGPLVAALLALAQCRLGRALSSTPAEARAARVAVLVSLPSFARALETGDLLSHAFVAALGAYALALAVEIDQGRARALHPLLLGLALGWAFAARLLDGVVIAGLVLGFLVVRRVPLRSFVLVAVGAAPFVALLLAHQWVSTGHLLRPTQAEHFARSDWPPTCHRLGFGTDVGCLVEHETERLSFGPDGYGPRDALRVVRERAAGLPGDLFGFAPLGLLAFAAPLLRRDRRDLALSAGALVFTLAYGLFYYGNAPVFGARHLFPLAPLLWLLAARALVAAPRLLVTLPLAAALAAVPRWSFGAIAVRHLQADRVDLRKLVDEQAIARGIFVTADELSWIGAFDSWADGPDRLLVRFDGSGLLELRRRRPDLGVHSLLVGDVHDARVIPPPRPGVTLELERAWPSWVRPEGLGSRIVHPKKCCGVDASGDAALELFAVGPGATLRIPFSVARAGTYTLRLDGLVGPDLGVFAVELDDVRLFEVDGYAPTVAARVGTPSAPRWLAEGRHLLTLRAVGKNPASAGSRGIFDLFSGLPAP